MEQNPYQAPEAQLLTTDEQTTDVPFYVVGNKKAWILFISTVGMYQIYWFYKHWRNIKDTEGSTIWPVPRAIFSYFFCHSLFRKIKEAHSMKASFISDWAPNTAATIYIIFTLFSSGTDRAAEKLSPSSGGILLILGIVASLIAIMAMMSAQKHVNDIAANSNIDLNENLTPANYIWIVIGILLWALVLFGIAATFNPNLI